MLTSQERTAAHARIGVLIRNGQTIYYANLDGGVYFEHSSKEEVEFYVELEAAAHGGTR